jgi:hypothetical protein
VLCGTGAILGVLIARPMLAVIARYASRYSVRALDLTVDSTLLWVGVSLALIASVLLAFVPRLPSADRRRARACRRQRAHHHRNESPSSACLRDADCRGVRAAGRRGRTADDADRVAADQERRELSNVWRFTCR